MSRVSGNAFCAAIGACRIPGPTIRTQAAPDIPGDAAAFLSDARWRYHASAAVSVTSATNMALAVVPSLGHIDRYAPDCASHLPNPCARMVVSGIWPSVLLEKVPSIHALQTRKTRATPTSAATSTYRRSRHDGENHPM